MPLRSGEVDLNLSSRSVRSALRQETTATATTTTALITAPIVSAIPSVTTMSIRAEPKRRASPGRTVGDGS